MALQCLRAANIRSAGLRVPFHRLTPMRILVSMRTPTNVRNFDSTLRELAARGHDVHVVFETMKKRIGESQTEQIESLCAEQPRVTSGIAPRPTPAKDLWFVVASNIRRAIDYLHYLSPEFRDAPKLRDRGSEQAPGWALRLGGSPLGRSPRAVRALSRALQRVERALPQDPRFEHYLRRERPDVVLVSPLVHIGTQGQVQLLRAARRRGIPTGLLVHSWDNLTTKGLIHEVPDMVAVWNEDQVREAVEMHGVPRDRLVVTGAPTYDQWFDWEASSTGEEFRAAVGLRRDRPYLLYLCSSYFIAPKEEEYVARWLDRLRASEHPELREVGVLIRPHPVAGDPWRQWDHTRWTNVAVHPRMGADPVNRNAKAEYFHSIHHSAAVIGVNTSALIETAIVGRAVHTLVVPEYRDTQDGTLHFRYLSRENGGPLVVSRSFDKHAAGLKRALRGDVAEDEAVRAFVHRFVRPLGESVRATDVLADAIVALGNTRIARGPQPHTRVSQGLRAAEARAFQIGLLRARRSKRTVGRA